MPVVYVQQLQQPALVGAFGSRRPAPSVILFQQPQQLALGGDIGREMPVPLTAHFQQPQWFAMSVPPVILFKQPEQLAIAGFRGTRMPAARVILFQQPEKLALGRHLASSPNSKLAPRAQLQPSSDKFTSQRSSSPRTISKSLTVDYAPNSPPQPFTSTVLYSPHFRLLISQTTPLYSTKQTKTNQYSQLTPVVYFNIPLLFNPFETLINYLPFWKA